MKLYRHVTANNIHLQEFPFLRELSMEAYLVENPEVLRLDDDELSDVNVVDVEVPVVKGRGSRNGDGRIDVIAQYREDTIAIIELKLGVLGVNHLSQLEDYLNEIDQVGEPLRNQLGIENPKYLGVLVGSDIEVGLSERIEKGEMVAGGIPIAALTIRRFRGEDSNIYVMTDVIFKNASRNFDRTQYLFNGRTYGKGRLVLAIVKRYVEDNPSVTYAELERTFPRKLQGSHGVFDTVEHAMEIFTRSSPSFAGNQIPDVSCTARQSDASTKDFHLFLERVYSKSPNDLRLPACIGAGLNRRRRVPPNCVVLKPAGS